MDRRAFLAIERVIRTDMTSEERARIGRVVREVAAGEALGALLGEKVVDLTETRRCPRCGADGIVKFGRDGDGQQRFRCRPGIGCGRTFNALTGSPMARMRKPAIWLSYAEALCERRSLDWIHEKLGIARLTAWRWRHRFGAALAAGPTDTVAGIVETYEVFFPPLVQRTPRLEARQSAGRSPAALSRIRRHQVEHLFPAGANRYRH